MTLCKTNTYIELTPKKKNKDYTCKSLFDLNLNSKNLYIVNCFRPILIYVITFTKNM